MPSGHPLRGEGRYSDPPTPSPLSPPKKYQRASVGARSQSSSPQKQRTKQPLHIRMNLTEMQMDRITDAFAYNVNSSPDKSSHKDKGSSSKSTPGGEKTNQVPQKTKYSLSSSDEDTQSMLSPTFSDLVPGHPTDLFSSNLAERRQKPPPQPIQANQGRPGARVPQRPRIESVRDTVSPLRPARVQMSHPDDIFEASPPDHRQRRSDISRPTPSSLMDSSLDCSSYYHSQPNDNDAVLDMYNNWARLHSPFVTPEPADRGQHLNNRPRRSKSTGEVLRRDNTAEVQQPAAMPMPAALQPNAQAAESPMFSPLAMYFRSQDFPTAKKGEKTMIGSNGWLERTEKPPDKTKKTPQKKVGILDSIKKIAKDMSELHQTHRRTHQAVKEPKSSQLAISLNAREQSLLYCELEFHLTSALNDYITVELDKGHLMRDNLKKIADAWYHQGRPRVVGFRYDLETQLELVNLHIEDFTFYGRRQGNPVEISGLIHIMKVNARAMRIHTFCQPDSVIAKQLVDAQSAFNLINAAKPQQIALAEVAQFFKVIVEREQDYQQRRSRKKRMTNADGLSIGAQGGPQKPHQGFVRERETFRDRTYAPSARHDEQERFVYSD